MVLAGKKTRQFIKSTHKIVTALFKKKKIIINYINKLRWQHSETEQANFYIFAFLLDFLQGILLITDMIT